MKTIQTLLEKSRHPSSTTTPAMIQALWQRLFREHTSQLALDWLHGFGNVVYADTYASPFIIQLYHNHPQDKRVAYLSETAGIVEWRFGIKSMGYRQCSVVTDPDSIAWLDSLFWFYIATELQKQQISRLTNIEQLVAERMHTIKKKQGIWKRL